MERFFSYQFIINALIISAICSLSSALIGTWVVIKRKVLISGGITHSSFGGIGIAYFLNMNPIIGSAIFAIATALGIEILSEKGKLREDSAIGMFWSLGMAIGILFISLTPGYAPDLLGYLFGNILTTSSADIILSGIITTLILIWFTVNYKKIIYIAFDEQYAQSLKVNTRFHNIMMMMLTAITIVMNIKVAGIILVISMLCIGQSAANLIVKNVKSIIIYSFAFNIIASFGGIVLSWYTNIPSGATIIIILTLIYIICATYQKSRKRLSAQ